MDVNDYLKDCKVNSGRSLVVGSAIYSDKIDRRTLYSDAIGLDMQHGEGVDIIHNLEQPLPEHHGQFDHIDCCSVLEHSERPWLVAENIAKLAKPGATILLSVPFVWRLHAYPSDYWRFSTETFTVLFPTVGWADRSYLCNGEIVRKPEHGSVDGKVYFARTEAVGFGVFIP